MSYNTDDWDYLYKYVPYEDKLFLTSTNMLYTPKINKEQNVLCMIWDENSEYQKDNAKLSKDLVDYFFNREITHLSLFQNKLWAPKIIDIDLTQRKIFVEWNNNLINHIIFDPLRNIDQEFPTWKEQLNIILADIYESGYYKMALYPHCFYIDQQSQVKTIDFYSCVGIEERYIPKKTLDGMIGKQSIERFNDALVGEDIDFKVFFQNTVKNHLNKTWPVNPFNSFVERYLK